VQANALVNEVEDKELTMKYQACYARIADSKRRFLDAAMKYYELSQASAATSCAPMHLTALSGPTCTGLVWKSHQGFSRVLIGAMCD
jgi:hypothetical protein